MATSRISLAVVWICLSVVAVYSEDKDVFSIYGKSVKLHCPLEPRSGIAWYDWVYNLSGDKPAVIYEEGESHDDEYHGGRFTVDPETLDLTISDLQEDDVGEYFCKSGGEEQKFVLALGNMPECKADRDLSNLKINDEAELECSMAYTGRAPEMQWLRGDEIVTSKDETDIATAMHKVDLDVDHTMDQQEFICRVVLADTVEECSLKTDVKYAVRDLAVTPEKEAYAPGSEFVCSAKGNPAPKVKVTFSDGEEKTGDGEVRVIVAEEWEGQSQWVLCEASNEEDGIPKSEKMNFTFTASSEAEPSPGDSEGGDGEVTGASTQTVAIVAGIVIGAVVLVVIIIAIVCVKKKQSKPPKGSKQVPTNDDVKGDANA